MELKYAWEQESTIKLAHLGCGGHSYRNIFPCYSFCPVDLVATVDRDQQRAQTCARNWGAQHLYTDLGEMLAEQHPDAVCVVTSYDAHGHPLYPQLAAQIMRAGAHAWIEKPPSASTQEIRDLMNISSETGKQVMVGFKKMFFPTIVKAKEIIASDEFGTPTLVTIRYPQNLPPPDQRSGTAMTGFLDHVVHPVSILQYLLGPIERLCFVRSKLTGATVTNLVFRSGTIGTMYLTAGQAETSPLERLEIIGEGTNLVIENGCRMTYYRRGTRGDGGYARGQSFIGSNQDAPLYWEPEFSLGGTMNNHLNLLGYLPQMLAFCQTVINNSPPEKCGLNDALEIMKVFEAYQTPTDQSGWIELPMP